MPKTEDIACAILEANIKLRVTMNGATPDVSTFGPNQSNDEDNNALGKLDESLEDAAPLSLDLNLYYDMSGDKYMIIFNHSEYKKKHLWSKPPPAPRDGTEADETRLCHLFGTLGFKVQPHNNLEHDQIIDEVLKVTRADHKNTSCIIVVIMTHGEDKGLVHAADRAYELDDIFRLFQNGHPSLVTTPKLFFIQACRGNAYDMGRVVTDGQRSPYILPTHMDFLILYATVEEYVSWRQLDGTFMIQELCNIIEEYASAMDILQIITLMNQRVACDRVATMKNDRRRFKQMPETRFTLTKCLRLL